MDLIPKCAAACLVEALPSSNCNVTDFGCMCMDQPLIQQTLACGLEACTPKEGLLAQRMLYTTCDYPVSHDRTAFPIVLIVGQVLAFISVALRIAVRLITSNIGFDDTTIMLSLGAVIAVFGLGLENQRLGLGTDLWFLPFGDITKFLHYYFAIETLYIASITLTKLSMLLLYLRLFPEKTMRMAIFITLGLTAAWGLSLLLSNVFSCTPVSYIWHSWDGEHEGSCISHEKVMWTHAITNIVFDVLIIALPMPTLLKLNMSMKKKIGVVIMFGVGLLVTAVSVLRCVTLLQFNIHDNATKKIVPVSIYSVVEMDLSIICACLPGIRAFIAYVHTAIYGKPESTTQYSYSGNKYSAQLSGRRAAPSPATKNLIPRPEAVRSGTFETGDFDSRHKMGTFIELQETNSHDPSRSDQSRSESRVSRAETVEPVGIALGSHSHSQSQSQRTSKTSWFEN
ncbi:CFEM domain-containing protein [Aspergillus stella-maris]|uniref:CFEM domain-containing protein n=1 Tax=Aspergillus stella-maris TaxID=1810926 RepID=UPI003CCCC5C9